MTEAEWLACDDPTPMLEFLIGKVSERKLRLFACACCRMISHLLREPCLPIAVEMAERFADAQVSAEDLEVASEDAWRTNLQLLEMVEGDKAYHAFFCAANAVAQSAAVPGSDNDYHCYHYRVIVAAGNVVSAGGSTRREEATLIRCILGPFPIQAMTFTPAWRTTTAMTLAEAIYTDRAFDCLPILADALEDAGCTNRDILDHCRQPGEHARGCWVVDLVLGKS